MHEHASTQSTPAPRAVAPRPRLARGAALAALALALAGAALAATRIEIAGHWQGVFLLAPPPDGGRLELKDDLFLGDGSRLIAGLSFSGVRRWLNAGPLGPGEPWLEVSWDEAQGNGVVRNHLADGTELVTLFSRFQDSSGKVTHGLFLGGALPDVAADPGEQNQSGMAYRDARGWAHVWCNTNEAAWDPARLADPIYPSSWKFLGSKLLIDDPARVVIQSSHELAVAGQPLQVERFAYFRAGSPWVRLGMRVLNAGDQPVPFSYAYGDEPWVGEFGSAKGNVGWTAGGIVRAEGQFDPAAGHAGILDVDSGVANFVAWAGEPPDLAYFANQPGLAVGGEGRPLASNEVFVGLEWGERLLAPGAQRTILLTLGLAPRGRDGVPFLPQGAR